MKKGGFSEEQILKLATTQDFHVSRYAWSHDGLRKKTRKMLQEGKLRLVAPPQDEFIYRTSASRIDSDS